MHGCLAAWELLLFKRFTVQIERVGPEEERSPTEAEPWWHPSLGKQCKEQHASSSSRFHLQLLKWNCVKQSLLTRGGDEMKTLLSWVLSVALSPHFSVRFVKSGALSTSTKWRRIPVTASKQGLGLVSRDFLTSLFIYLFIYVEIRLDCKMMAIRLDMNTFIAGSSAVTYH